MPPSVHALARPRAAGEEGARQHAKLSRTDAARVRGWSAAGIDRATVRANRAAFLDMVKGWRG
jgi:hypothetical protein